MKVVPLAIIIFLCISPLVAVYATAPSWNLDSVSSGWVSNNSWNWESADNSNSADFTYSCLNVSNFQTWSFGFKTVSITVGGVWLMSSMNHWGTFTLNDVSNTHTLVLKLRVKAGLSVLGWVNYNTEWMYSFDGSAYDFNTFILNNWVDTDVWFYKSASDVLSVSLVTLNHNNGTVIQKYIYDFTVGSSWFSHVDMHQRIDKTVEWWATGKVIGEKCDEVYTTGTSSVGEPSANVHVPSLAEQIAGAFISGFKFIWDGLLSVLPEGVRNPLNSTMGHIGGFGSLVVSILGSVFSFVVSNYLLIFGMWGLYELAWLVKYAENGGISAFVEHWRSNLDHVIHFGEILFSIARTVVALIKWW